MNYNEIIAAAREAGITASLGQTINGHYKPNTNALGKSVPAEWLLRFAAIIAARERDELLAALDKVREMPQWEHVAIGIRTEIEAAIAKIKGEYK